MTHIAANSVSSTSSVPALQWLGTSAHACIASGVDRSAQACTNHFTKCNMTALEMNELISNMGNGIATLIADGGETKTPEASTATGGCAPSTARSAEHAD